MAQLRHRLRFDLADAFARHAVHAANVVERLRLAVLKAVAHLDPRAMADQARTIRVPVHMVEVINKLSRVQRQMLQDLGREPTPDELARELDMPVCVPKGRLPVRR